MVRLDTSLLSIPTSISGSPTVLAVLAESGRKVLLSFEQRMLRSPSEVVIIHQQIGEPKHYLMTTLGVADVSDCFHRLRFGSEPAVRDLKKYFAYPIVRAGDVGVTSIDGTPVSADLMVFPRAESFPMGWSWSLFFAQSANAFQLSRSLRHLRPHVMSDRGLPLIFRPSSEDVRSGRACTSITWDCCPPTGRASDRS